MRKFATIAVVALCATGFTAGAAYASQTQIDLSSYTNENIQTYTDGTNYPFAGSTVAIGGVDFTLSSYQGGADTTGVVQANTSTDSFLINVSQSGVATVYVLMNSAYGEFGATVGSLTFTDSENNTDVISIVEGVNVRDHYVVFNNVATDVYGTANYPGDVKLDAYAYNLSGLNGNLVSITFTGAQDTGYPNGQPFIAGVTLATGVPEASTWAMMMAGFAGLGWLGFVRGRAGRAAAA